MKIIFAVFIYCLFLMLMKRLAEDTKPTAKQRVFSNCSLDNMSYKYVARVRKFIAPRSNFSENDRQFVNIGSLNSFAATL